ncbi:MAG: diacylglycerol kinase family protein [Anaerolineales bacterium]|nr:diacylglycerol kinase family protein [Anaerolineales bacterium]
MRSPNQSNSRPESFKHAFSGWIYVIKTQRNAWIHAVATLLVFLIAAVLELCALEIALIVVAVGMVWMAELFNTAVEVIVDMITPEYHPLAKIAKDVSATAVLVSALTALIIGILLMGRPLLALVLDL